MPTDKMIGEGDAANFVEEFMTTKGPGTKRVLTQGFGEGLL